MRSRCTSCTTIVRIHASLRMTPAMAAGVTGKLWEIADIVALIEAKEAEKPVVRSPSKNSELRGNGSQSDLCVNR